MILFSALFGVVLAHGVPVSGATVEREVKWAWSGATYVDRVVTDAQGRFQFAPLVGRSLSARLLPHEPNVRQTLSVSYGSANHRIWMHNRRDYGAEPELGATPQVVRFELTATLAHRGEVYGLFEGPTPKTE